MASAENPTLGFPEEAPLLRLLGNGIGVPLREPVRPEGLNSDEVSERVKNGLGNAAAEAPSKSVAEIVRSNTLTRFNFILGVLFVAILTTGVFQDALFGIVAVINSSIGIVQELKTKRTLDRLAVLNAPRARALRDGVVQDIPVEGVVLDDLIVLHSGDQVSADGIVSQSEGLQIDESLLSGESQPMEKHSGEPVLSGSFVVAGTGRYQVTAVGHNSYARGLARQARQFAVTPSELMRGINQILRYVTWALPVVAVLLLVSQFRSGGLERASVAGVVAALVGMVPQGLVLLTSIAFGVAVLKLARKKVIVRELAAVEGLA